MKIISRICSFEGCERAHHAKGLCHSHDMQRRKGMELKPIVFAKDVPCSHDDCKKPSKVKGLCQNHYSNQYVQRKRTESAHPCRACDDGVAYWKSAMCEDCKARERDVARLSKPAALNAAHRSNKPQCDVGGCDRPISANTIKVGTLASRLCARHCSDASSKTMGVDEYLGVMAVDSCEACGSRDRLVVDHRHGHHDHHAKMCPDCIRGRLCSDCNSALGLLRESSERVEALARYIASYPGKF